jgi:hypothetical protein
MKSVGDGSRTRVRLVPDEGGTSARAPPDLEPLLRLLAELLATSDRGRQPFSRN